MEKEGEKRWTEWWCVPLCVCVSGEWVSEWVSEQPCLSLVSIQWLARFDCQIGFFCVIFSRHTHKASGLVPDWHTICVWMQAVHSTFWYQRWWWWWWCVLSGTDNVEKLVSDFFYLFLFGEGGRAKRGGSSASSSPPILPPPLFHQLKIQLETGPANHSPVFDNSATTVVWWMMQSALTTICLMALFFFFECDVSLINRAK